MTRADSGELKLNMKSAHLPDVIIEAVARLEPQYKKRNQTVMLDLDDNLPAVYIDPDRIIQVLTNLVMNAIKYSPEGGKIRVSTQHIVKAKQLPSGAPRDMTMPAVIVSVIDEGKGLSAEDIEQIFQPFFRTEWARTNKIEGTGLGLAVSRSIIELHRGCIWAEVSTAKRPGGRFLFNIPLTPISS
jgi:signal transduction histidine kinase